MSWNTLFVSFRYELGDNVEHVQDLDDTFWRLVEPMMTAEHEQMMDLAPGEGTTRTIMDPVEMGRRIKSARALKGLEVEDLSARIRELTPRTAASKPTLYNIEKGLQTPSLELMMALIVILEPPGGWAWFSEAIRPELRDLLTASMRVE